MIMLIHAEEHTTAINLSNVTRISATPLFDDKGKLKLRDGTTIETTDGRRSSYFVKHAKVLEAIRNASAVIDIYGDDE